MRMTRREEGEARVRVDWTLWQDGQYPYTYLLADSAQSHVWLGQGYIRVLCTVQCIYCLFGYILPLSSCPSEGTSQFHANNSLRFQPEISWHCRDSNPRPWPLWPDTLPTELSRLYWAILSVQYVTWPPQYSVIYTFDIISKLYKDPNQSSDLMNVKISIL